MSVDLNSLREMVSQIEADVARLRALLDSQANGEAGAITMTAAGAATILADLALPETICVPRPDRVAAYLAERPGLSDIVKGMAAALVKEFENEPSQLILDVYDDPEIDDHNLKYIVRLPKYDGSLRPRLDHVWEPFAEQMVRAREGVNVTTDYRSMD